MISQRGENNKRKIIEGENGCYAEMACVHLVFCILKALWHALFMSSNSHRRYVGSRFTAEETEAQVVELKKIDKNLALMPEFAWSPNFVHSPIMLCSIK